MSGEEIAYRMTLLSAHPPTQLGRTPGRPYITIHESEEETKHTVITKKIEITRVQ